jgi:hypothetical protein
MDFYYKKYLLHRKESYRALSQGRASPAKTQTIYKEVNRRI